MRKTEDGKTYGDLNIGDTKGGKTIESIKNKMDYFIGRFVHDKKGIRKAFDYYKGYRDLSDYAYLEDNYGIGNPAKIKLTPVMSSRIDILVGIMLSQDSKAQVFTIDKDTISKELEEELTYINNETDKMLKNIFDNGMKDKKEFKRIVDTTADKISANGDFISSFQSDSQHIVNLYLENTEMNFDYFKEEFFRYLLLGGEAVFKERKTIRGEYPGNDMCLSEDIFFQKTKGTRDIESSPAIVYRQYKTKHQVLIELGRFMTKEQKKEFLTDAHIANTARSNMMKRVAPLNAYAIDPREHATYFGDDDIYNEYYRYMGDYVEVVHVEYKESEEITVEPSSLEDRIAILLGKKKKEKKFIEFRYSGYRIGNYYYINVGKDEDAKRNLLNPSKVQYTYHGFSLNTFNSKPTSIGYSLIDIQDMIDIVKFHRENLIHNSGVNGSRVNIASIPHFLGDEMMERVNSWIALSKQGKELIDPTLPGASTFQHYGDYKNSVDGQALQAIDAVLAGLNYDADLAAGINRNMRGAIEQREAVSNVKTGITMSSYANKHYYNILDNSMSKALTLLLDNTKIAFPDGFSGSYYKGANKVTFNALPEKYIPSQFIVAIKRDDTDEIELQGMKHTMDQLAINGIVYPEASIAIRKTKSIYEAENLSEKFIKEKRKDDDEKGKLRQQLQKYENNMKEQENLIKEMQTTIDNFNKKHFELEDKKIAIKDKEIDAKISLDNSKFLNEKKVKEQELEEVEKRTELEREELYMATGNAKEVKNLNK